MSDVAIAFLAGFGFGFILNAALHWWLDARATNRPPDFHSARIGAASALVSSACFIVIVDTVDSTRQASPVILAALLGTVVTLLGIEARALVGR